MGKGKSKKIPINLNTMGRKWLGGDIRKKKKRIMSPTSKKARSNTQRPGSHDASEGQTD